MTVSNLTNKVSYIGIGSIYDYSYSFKIFNQGDLQVFETDLDDNTTLLVLNDDYYVSGVSNSAGGTVSLRLPLALNHSLTILRQLDLLQETHYRNQGAFFPERHEDSFDRCAMIDQQLKEVIDRSLKAPVTPDDISLDLPRPDPGHILGWASDGKSIINVASADASLRNDLENDSDTSKGSAMVGNGLDFLNAAGRTVYEKLNEILSSGDFAGTSETNKIENAIASIKTTSSKSGFIIIPPGWDQTIDLPLLELSNGQGISILDLRSFRNGGLRLYSESKDNSGYYLTEFVIAGKQNPGIVLETMSDGTAEGYPVPNLSTSLVVRKGSTSYWQLISDPLFLGHNIWSFQNVASSRQFLTMHSTGEMTYGEMDSMDFSTPDYPHIFRGSVFCFENKTGNVSIIIRLSDNSKRKIVTLNSSDDSIQISNTANDAVILKLSNNGNLKTSSGINGNAFLTIDRPTLGHNDIGTMIFDTSLNKPIWFSNDVGPIWVDATGTTV